MSKEMLSLKDENTILLTLKFLENGLMLKSGWTQIQTYELDLIVRNDITLDQLLGSVYAGIRDVLQNKYNLDLKESIAGLVYQDLTDPYAFRAGDSDRGNGRLRRGKLYEFRMRDLNRRYQKQRQQQAEHDKKYPFHSRDTVEMTPEEQERLNWIVCWQVFHECFAAYAVGYPDSGAKATADTVRTEEFLRHPVIARGSVDLRNVPDGTHLGTSQKPQLPLEKSLHGDMTLRDLGFLTSSLLIFDPVMWHLSGALYDDRELDAVAKDNIPGYRLGNRSVLTPDTPQIRIHPHTNPAVPPRAEIAAMLLPLLILTGVVLGVWATAGSLSAESMLPLFGVMIVLAALFGGVNWCLVKLKRKWDMRAWLTEYEQYIRRVIEQIVEHQTLDIQLMKEMYPPVFDKKKGDDLISRTLKICGDLFGRRPDQPDFLRVRLGLSTGDSRLVPSLFSIIGEKINTSFSGVRYKNLRSHHEPFRLVLEKAPRDARTDLEDASGFLEDLPAAIAREYGSLSDAPVMLDLKQSAAVGLVFPDSSMQFDPYLSNLVLDLCVHHSPEDLQFVMLCRETDDWKTRHEMIRRYKHLPHFRKLMDDQSAFAFSKKEAWDLFDRVLQIQVRREQGEQLPHIVVLVQKEYDLRSHSLGQYLPSDALTLEARKSISFVLCARSERELPPYCGNVIYAGPGWDWFLLPYHQNLDRSVEPKDLRTWGQYAFRPDAVIDSNGLPEQDRDRDRFHRAFKTVSALYHHKHAQTAVPVFLDLFRLLSGDAVRQGQGFRLDIQEGESAAHAAQRLRGQLDNYVNQQWMRLYNGSLEVPIGHDGDSIVSLDLHETAAGANLLITGDAKTGKTEAALTCLISLCTHYAPEIVNVLPVDLCGTGLTAVLDELPHVPETVAIQGNTPGHVRREIRNLLMRLDGEISRRKLLLKQMGVDNVDEYIQARESMPLSLLQKLRLHPKQDAERIQRMREMEPMPHLFVVLDDFDDLLHHASAAQTGDESLDLNDALSRILQAGTGLGIHLIVLAKRVEHTISDELMNRLSVRICLKVSSLETSRRTIHDDTAALDTMPGDGRACLRCTGSSYTDYFQVGYSGADIATRPYAPFRITLAPAGGRNIRFFDSDTYIPPADEEVRNYHAAASEPLDVRYKERNDDADWYSESAWHGPEPGSHPNDGGNGRVGDPRPNDGGNGRVGDPRPNDGGNGRVGDPRPNDGGNGHVGDPRYGDDGNAYVGDHRFGDGGSRSIGDHRNENRSARYEGDQRFRGTQSKENPNVDSSYGRPVDGIPDNFQQEKKQNKERPRKETPDFEARRQAHLRQQAARKKKPDWEDPKFHQEWRERYFRRWQGHNYKYVPPGYREAAPEQPEMTRFPRPDEALLRHPSVGITQAGCMAGVIREYDAGRRSVAQEESEEPVPV